MLFSEKPGLVIQVKDSRFVTALLEKDIVPGTGDSDTLRASFAKVRRLKERLPALAIVASHDFAAGEAVSRATRRSSQIEQG